MLITEIELLLKYKHEAIKLTCANGHLQASNHLHQRLHTAEVVIIARQTGLPVDCVELKETALKDIRMEKELNRAILEACVAIVDQTSSSTLKPLESIICKAGYFGIWALGHAFHTTVQTAMDCDGRRAMTCICIELDKTHRLLFQTASKDSIRLVMSVEGKNMSFHGVGGRIVEKRVCASIRDMIPIDHRTRSCIKG